jgi:hypothetical protein
MDSEYDTNNFELDMFEFNTQSEWRSLKDVDVMGSFVDCCYTKVLDNVGSGKVVDSDIIYRVG